MKGFESMLGWLIGVAVVSGLLGWKVGIYTQAFRYNKKPKVPPYDKLVKLEVYRKYRIK